MEIQPGDKKLRLMIGLAFIVAVAIGALSLLAFEGWLNDVRHMTPGEGRRMLLSAFAWLIGTALIGLLLMGIYFWRWGARVHAAAQFPLPGTRVVRDTVVLRGEAALRRSKVIQGIGAALVFCALALFAACWYLYFSLFANTT